MYYLEIEFLYKFSPLVIAFPSIILQTIIIILWLAVVNLSEFSKETNRHSDDSLKSLSCLPVGESRNQTHLTSVRPLEFRAFRGNK